MSAHRTAHERPSRRAPEGIAERIFRLLLCAYPAPFRAAYGHEMTLLFRDQRRDAGSGALFWAAVLWDVLRSAPEARAEAFRARWAGHTLDEEGPMRPMSMLALLFGAVDVLNALIEGRAGWTSEGGMVWLSSVAVVVLGGVVLAVAGVALLRRAPASGLFARASAMGCLVLVAGAELLHPWMSVFARLVGMGFPIALILFLSSAHGRGPSAPVAS